MARNLGFAGKSCIHPCQVELANRIFSPSSEEVAAAERCLQSASAAATLGVGAFAVDGRMVDAPFVRKAESILALAEKIGAMERNREES
jgi:citrate lyase subunit beta/citryl-CoA lyase